MIISSRIKHEYSSKNIYEYDIEKQIAFLQIKLLKSKKKSDIFSNQETTGNEIVNNFKNPKIINQMILGLTQSGKTGTMLATIKSYLECPDNIIPIENIYVITGLSSIDWKEQTKERLPKSIEDRVFHRSELPTTFVEEIQSKVNILIIMDEIHIAAKKGQTIYKTFEGAGLYDLDNFFKKDIKILEFTATPDGTIYDLMKWKNKCDNYSLKILSDPGKGYTSCFDLYDDNRIRQFKDLCCCDKITGIIDKETARNNIKEIKDIIIKYGDNYKYHIIRTKNAEYQNDTLKNLKNTFPDKDYFYIKFDKDNDTLDINKILTQCPKKHTFILIKEKLRCSKTLCKIYLGIIYERYARNVDDAVIIQGLIGRLTGYDDNKTSICFSNIETVEKYKKLWDSNFEDTNVKWASKTTKVSRGILVGRDTFNDADNIDGISISSEDYQQNEIKPVIKTFPTFEAAKQFYREELKTRFGGNGPQNRKKNINSNGFYETTVRKTKKVFSSAEIISEAKWGISQNIDDKKPIKDASNAYRLHPCYLDINDKNTIQWLLIYYD